eukprot:GEMP01033253.1.p1 GENE.GEMP01033253.1~~GEMP01033253.1.p1  ORF type:complete len:408 (+),score=87.73 GEMP01033253.1:61-1224(+)
MSLYTAQASASTSIPMMHMQPHPLEGIPVTLMPFPATPSSRGFPASPSRGFSAPSSMGFPLNAGFALGSSPSVRTPSSVSSHAVPASHLSTSAHIFSADVAGKSIAYLRQLLEESIKHSVDITDQITQLQTEAVLLRGDVDFLEEQQELLFQRSPMDSDAVKQLEGLYRTRISQLEDAFMEANQQQRAAVYRNTQTARRLEEAAALSAGAPESIRAFLHLQAAILRHESESSWQLPCLQAFLEASPGSYADSLAVVLETIGLRPPTEIKKKAFYVPPPENSVLKWCSDVFSQSTSTPVPSEESLNMARELEVLKEQLHTNEIAHAETVAKLKRELQVAKRKPATDHKEVQANVILTPTASPYLHTVKQLEAMRKAAYERQRKNALQK